MHSFLFREYASRESQVRKWNWTSTWQLHDVHVCMATFQSKLHNWPRNSHEIATSHTPHFTLPPNYLAWLLYTGQLKFPSRPPPTPIEPGGTYARSPSPEPPPPLSREKDYTPLYLGYWLPVATKPNFITKTHTPFSGFSREIFPRLLPKNAPPPPHFPRKWEYACCPLMHSSGGGGGGA